VKEPTIWREVGKKKAVLRRKRGGAGGGRGQSGPGLRNKRSKKRLLGDPKKSPDKRTSKASTNGVGRGRGGMYIYSDGRCSDEGVEWKIHKVGRPSSIPLRSSKKIRAKNNAGEKQKADWQRSTNNPGLGTRVKKTVRLFHEGEKQSPSQG